MDSKRLLAEGFVIVGSILLAFAIDAAWEGRIERQRLERLTISLHADVEATRRAIQSRAQEVERIAFVSRNILDGIAAGAEGPTLDSLVFLVGNVFVQGKWTPINHTYEQALGGGDLALIEDADLRLLLGQYAESLDQVGRYQDASTTQYYGQLEPFLVANTDYAQVASDVEGGNLVRGPFLTDSRALASRRDFFNLLNLKLELELEMAGTLANAMALADLLLEALASEAASGSAS